MQNNINLVLIKDNFWNTAKDSEQFAEFCGSCTKQEPTNKDTSPGTQSLPKLSQHELMTTAIYVLLQYIICQCKHFWNLQFTNTLPKCLHN